MIPIGDLSLRGCMRSADRFGILLMTISRWIAMSESVELNREKRVCFL